MEPVEQVDSCQNINKENTVRYGQYADVIWSKLHRVPLTTADNSFESDNMAKEEFWSDFWLRTAPYWVAEASKLPICNLKRRRVTRLRITNWFNWSFDMKSCRTRVVFARSSGLSWGETSSEALYGDCLKFCQIYNVKRHRFNAHTLRIVYSNGLIAGKMSTSCNTVAKCDGGISHTFSFMCRRHFRADCSRIAHSCRHFEQKFVTETVSYSKLMLFCFL